MKRLTLLAACAGVGLSASVFSQTQVSWTGGGGGPWNVAGNWTPNQVPNNINPLGPFYVASINQSGPGININATIVGLNITDSLSFVPGGFLAFDSPDHTTFVNGGGSITIAPATSSQAMFIAGGASLTLSGGGTIMLGGAGTARLSGNPGSRLINTNWTIVGEGVLFEGGAALTNGGTLLATGGLLAVSAAGIINTGFIGAGPGGSLSLNGGFGSINNSGGTIHADGGHIQLFNALVIEDGVLSTAGSGSIEVVPGGFGVVTLDGVTNTGNLRVGNSNLDLKNTTVNSGSITVVGSLRAVNTATLNGGGAVQLMPGSTVTGSGGSGTLVNSANTFSGAGNFGADKLTIINQPDGLIRASGGTLTLNPDAGGMTNSGTLMASNGGTLVLSGQGGGSFDNFGGTLIADDAEVILTSGASITGGTIKAQGSGGLVYVATLDTATLEDVTIVGSMAAKNSSTVIMRGLVTGSADFTLEANSRIQIPGELTAGLSHMAMQVGSVLEGLNDNQTDRGGLGPSITNTGSIGGAGNIGNNTLQITNNGTIVGNVDVSGVAQPLILNPSPEGLINGQFIQASGFGAVILEGAGSGVFTQTAGGTIRALGNGHVRIQGNAFISGGMFGSGTGSISLVSGSTVLQDLTTDANLTQSAVTTFTMNGNIVNTGTITVPSSGTLIVAGSSTLNSSSGHVVNNGTIAINSAGLVDANFIVGTGRVIVLPGGTVRAHSITQGSLIINNNAFGALKTSFVPGVDPSRVGNLSVGAVGASLDLANRVLIVDYSAGGSTTFNTIRSLLTSGYNSGAWNGFGINSSVAAANPGFGVGQAEASALFTTFPATFAGQSVDSSTVLLKYTYYGDANLDGQVDISDLARLATSWQTVGVWTNGDFDYSGFIDITDLARLATNWQAGVGAPLSMSFEQALASVGLGGVSVPEPGVLGLLLAPLLSARRRRRPGAPATRA